ncbi:MAG TPA: hypothetical protein ENK75_04935, partial [Saprospiraceae bacterium]|nr:hypothetical protein [Saprospiraceae bacterium]
MTLEEVLYRYKNTYYSFPQPLKLFLGDLYGSLPLRFRYGNNYELHKRILEKFENSDAQYKQEFMFNKTLETILFAEKNIPYYKETFAKSGISASDFKELTDMKKFPVIGKQDIKKNLEQIHTDIKEKPVAYHSGGSMTTPTKFYLPSSSRAKEKAYVNYIFSKINYKYRDKTGVLKGRKPSKPEENIFWDYDPLDNFFFVSNNYMNS